MPGLSSLEILQGTAAAGVGALGIAIDACEIQAEPIEVIGAPPAKS
jgi:hypothetical protein